MTEARPAPTARTVLRRYWWVALVLAALAALGIGLAVANGQGPASSDPAPATSGSTPPSASPSPTSDGEPSPEPEQTPDAAPPAGEPVAFGEPASVVPEVTATVTSVEAVAGEANGPGEVAGPALRFTVSIENRTGAAIQLGNTVVNAYTGAEQTPADVLSGPGVQPLPATLESGQTATGVFVFSIDESERDLVRVTVDYAAGIPVAAFEGSAPLG